MFNFNEHLIASSSSADVPWSASDMMSVGNEENYGAANGSKNAAYLGVFTVLNLIFLALLLLSYYLFNFGIIH